jgi:hypothetical protein
MKDTWGPYVYNQGPARRSVLGGRTINPSPAATQVLGKKRAARGRAVLKKRGRRSAHRGNPVPALVATLAPIIGKYLHIGGPDPAKQTLRLAKLQQYAEASDLKNLDAIARREEGHGVAINDVIVAAAAELASKVRAHQVSTATPPKTETELASLLKNPLTVPIVRELTKKPRAPRRQRYPTYVDRGGRQKYSYKPPGSDLRIPAGATPSPGSPYSFFRGSVGGGGAGTTLGQFAVAGAAGAAAYLVTQKLLQYLGGRAQSAEEAGVNAARAHREALLELQQRLGRAPNAAEKAEINTAYKSKLIELGYDPVTFTRPRSGLTDFLETYNPLGG